ncbi:Hint domain-containing protein [Psychrobacter immobilis]|uniref:Hint domain-containing protein n=1 Tax=Psychrobacter immobilis TaxID=498 RepID=UPI00191953D4|nr:Hint domain-containing protein [Psychrobacter immobilis]
MNNKGFVAGTLVHTDKGLVPIQDIKVGDLILSKPVLSKSEDGSGDIDYKPVLSTFKSPNKKSIFKVEYFNETADARGEKGSNYIFCTSNHPFWVTRQPEDKEGEWLSAERLPARYLTSAHGDTIALDDYSFIPVRTLPNYPEGCAYIQNIQDKDLWETDGLVQFVKFSDSGYQYVSLANTEEAFKEEIKTVNLQTSDAKLLINEKAPFIIDPDLYKTLNVRLRQDIAPKTHSAERFVREMHSPLIFEGKIIKENRIGDEGLFKKALASIKKYGDSMGLTDESIHKQMRRYNDICPNP